MTFDEALARAITKAETALTFAESLDPYEFKEPDRQDPKEGPDRRNYSISCRMHGIAIVRKCRSLGEIMEIAVKETNRYRDATNAGTGWCGMGRIYEVIAQVYCDVKRDTQP